LHLEKEDKTPRIIFNNPIFREIDVK